MRLMEAGNWPPLLSKVTSARRFKAKAMPCAWSAEAKKKREARDNVLAVREFLAAEAKRVKEGSAGLAAVEKAAAAINSTEAFCFLRY